MAVSSIIWSDVLQAVLVFIGTCSNLMIAAAAAVTAAAAAATAVAAWCGLHTWRRKIRAESELEVARGLLRSALRVRNAIRHARGRFFAPRPDMPSDESWVSAWHARMKSMFDTLTEFDAQILEAEALWGEQAKRASGPLDCASQGYMRATLRYVGEQLDERYQLTQEELKQARGLAWEVPGEEDAFAQELEEAMRKLEEFARPYLQVQT